MTAFLVDEMFPPTAPALLREKYGLPRSTSARRASLVPKMLSSPRLRAEGRAVVTQNVADFAVERDVVLFFILKKNLPAGGAQTAALAAVLDRWGARAPKALPRRRPAAHMTRAHQRVFRRRPEPGGHQERAELAGVQPGGIGLVVQVAPADVRGGRVIEQLFLHRVAVDPGDGAQPPGDDGRARPLASRSRAKNSMSARRAWNRRS